MAVVGATPNATATMIREALRQQSLLVELVDLMFVLARGKAITEAPVGTLKGATRKFRKADTSTCASLKANDHAIGKAQHNDMHDPR